MKDSKTEAFIHKAKLVHNDKYDYSKVNYIGCFDKVCIICPEHGEFWQNHSIIFKDVVVLNVDMKRMDWNIDLL